MPRAIENVCVFCGSRPGNDPAFAQTAARLGVLFVENRLGLVYGGGGIGLMGIVTQTVLENGGCVTGVIPEFLMTPEVGNPNVTELLVVRTMHERKMTMFERSDAFIALPGGVGTLDEVVEVITWRQLRQHAKPVILVDVNGYWTPFVGMMNAVVSAGFASSTLPELFRVVPSADAALEALEALEYAN